MNKGTILIRALLLKHGIGNQKVYDYIYENNFNYEECLSNVEDIMPRELFDDYLTIAEKEVDENLKLGIESISLFDEDYPSKLFTIKDPVLYLYYKGDISLINKKSLAVIGSRKASEDSLLKTKLYTNKFVENEIVIISGLALGVDSTAHKACVENHGKTIAVMPCGLDVIEPSSNKKLAFEILEEGGCLVSEYSCGTMISKYNYIKRDRIQSALANCILVTEAAEKSGTMNAVNKNFESGKDVYQDLNNDNTFIKNNVDLNDDDITIILESINKDAEKGKVADKLILKQKTYIGNKVDQISLF